MKTILFCVIAFFSMFSQASSIDIKFNDPEIKNEISRRINLEANQFEIEPVGMEFVKEKTKVNENIIVDRFFITWNVRRIINQDSKFVYEDKSGHKFDAGTIPIDGVSIGDDIGTIKMGYQFSKRTSIDIGMEKNTSKYDLYSLDGFPLGYFSKPNDSNSIKNEITTVKIGLNTGVNIITTRNWKLDVIASINAGVVHIDSTSNKSAKSYSGKIGYVVGGEVGVMVENRSGLFLEIGAGKTNKTLMPYTVGDYTSTEYSGSETYVFINVGYRF